MLDFFKVLKKRRPTDLLPWLISAVLSVVITLIPLDYFEAYLYDLRVKAKPSPLLSPILETIIIEPTTIQSLKRMPNLSDHIRFLSKLSEQHPKVVVYLISPKDLIGDEGDQKAFVNLALSFREFYVVTNELAMRGETGKFDLPGPLKPLKVLSGPITSDTKILAQDGVTRRLMLTYQGQLLFHPFLVGQLVPERRIPENIRGHFEFYDSEQAYIDMAPSGRFPKTKFIDVINELPSASRFQDKIVLIGTNLEESTREYIKTPYSRQVTAMTVVEAHANILNSLIMNTGPKTAPSWLNFVMLLILVILSVEVVLGMKPLRGILVLGMTVAVLCVASFIAFWPFGWWVNMAPPLLGIFLAYYLLIPYRLIVENRRSWELYQKNKLLTQVEELKTNFIGMMSHDLKTPLARISGMLEIVLRDKTPLSDDQKHALKSIQKSTEDLLNFISSILNFSRIESQGVQLNLKSKDVNSLVEEVLQKTEYLAKEKKIKIIKELEPLFSLKIDPDLIRQAITNLVENAIKYSPNDSRVTVKTEERNNKVLIHVIDQGIGIPEDERSRLFMKFFRSRKAKDSAVKGSGLGLYLSRYFVELHHGRLSAESVENKGSTFTIELPIVE